MAKPDAPIMPKEAKLRRKKRSMAQDTTERPPRSAYKKMGFTDAELKKMGMKDGGEAVPKKFKGFSKLPESVQQKMDPGLANKYRDGGEARNSGSKGSCRGMGAAMRGGSFSGVK